MRNEHQRTKLVLRNMLSIALGLGLAFSATAKEWKSITIATEGAYQPWNITLPGGKIGGFEPELMDNLCQRMQIKCTIVVQNWDGMIAGLQAGKFDVIMDSIVITPDREKQIDFTIPYASTPATFVSLKGQLLPPPKADAPALTISGSDDQNKQALAALRTALKGKTIGISTGNVYNAFLDKYFGDIATIRQYSTSADAFLDLQTERIDAVLDDETISQSMVTSKGYENLDYMGPKLKGTELGGVEAFGVRKSDADLREKFNVALKAAIADGTVKTLSEKWFKTDVTP